MPNVKSIINRYNKVVLDPPASASKTTCKCINEEKCPLHQKCLTNNMNKVTLTSNQDTYQHKIIYCGITETKFKQRYTKNPSGMRSIKATLNFRMNFGASKSANTLEILYEKYLGNTSRIIPTPKGASFI